MEKIITIYPNGNNLKTLLEEKFGNSQFQMYGGNYICGGRGTCGKCKVLVEEKGDWVEHLSCQYIPQEVCRVKLSDKEEDFQIEGMQASEIHQKLQKVYNFQIVVDIGTTTVAMILIDDSGQVLSSWTGLNPQRKYGADVITRIEKAEKGCAEELKNCIREKIAEGMEKLIDGWKNVRVSRIVFAGNTAMQHFFAGYPTAGLGTYPFQVYQTELVKGKLTEIYPRLSRAFLQSEYVIMPCISAFVGGDVMAGLLEVNELEKMVQHKNWLFLDIGTNGEMVLYENGLFYVCSAAAGPVFEGGTIRWGIGSVIGAIDRVFIEQGELCCSTIGEQPAIGICGTGLIEAIASLKKIGILCQDGLLKGYEKTGYVLARTKEGEKIVITQEDIRQFQLAKAAICTGIELLCHAAGKELIQVEKIYLAGGFGTKLDIGKSCEAGLFSQIIKRKSYALGNTSLKGGIQFCVNEKAEELLHHIKMSSRVVTLALEEGFQERYLEYMKF